MGTATVNAPKRGGPPEWLDPEVRYEIIDGDYVEKERMSTLALKISTRIAGKINHHAFQDHGEATCELVIELPGLDRTRIPDLAYVSYTTWPKDKPAPEPDAWPIAPDLCIEVISPSERLIAAKEKMHEYFAAGVKQVWWVTPTLIQLEVYTSPTQSRIFAAYDSVDCGAVIPGFQFCLADVM